MRPFTCRGKVDDAFPKAFQRGLWIGEDRTELIKLHRDVPVARLCDPVCVQPRKVEPHAVPLLSALTAIRVEDTRAHLRSPMKKVWSNRSGKGMPDWSRPVKSSTLSSERILTIFALRISRFLAYRFVTFSDT